MSDEKLETELELLARLLRQLPEVELEVRRCEAMLESARSNVEYVKEGIEDVRARVCNLLMPPNIIVAGPSLDKAISALTPISGEEGEALLGSQPEPSGAEVRKQDEQDAALEEFMKRPGAAQVQPGEFIEAGVIDRHWLHEDGHIETTPNPSIIWPREANHGSIIAYAPVDPTPEKIEQYFVEMPDAQFEAVKAAASGETASELETQSEVGGDRVAPHDLPALSDEAFNALPKLDDTAVIDAEPPTIPRSEIPEGVAVETFTEQGVETVKIGGLTHIVEGEAPVDKFSAIRDGGDAGFWAAARGLTKIEEMA